MNAIAIRTLERAAGEHTGPANIAAAEFTRYAAFITGLGKTREVDPGVGELGVIIFNHYLSLGIGGETNIRQIAVACYYISNVLHRTSYTKLSQFVAYLLVGNIQTFHATIILIVTKLGGKVPLVYPSYVVSNLSRVGAITSTETQTLLAYIPIMITQLGAHNHDVASFVLGLIWALRDNSKPILDATPVSSQLITEARQLLSGMDPVVRYTLPKQVIAEPIIDRRGEVLIGEGSYGTVSKTTDGYAVKVIEDSLLDSITEVAAMRTISHPNVQSLVAFAFNANSNKCLLKMPFYDSDLEYIILRRQLDLESRRNLGRQIVASIAAIHSTGIVHGDVKPGNMLVSSTGALVITDFGQTQFYHTGRPRSMLVSGTLTYMAPELLRVLINDNGEVYSQSFECDIWSVGITLLELELGKYFVPDIDEPQAVLDFITAELTTTLSGITNIPFRDMLRRILSVDSAYRPTAREILANY